MDSDTPPKVVVVGSGVVPAVVCLLLEDQAKVIHISEQSTSVIETSKDVINYNCCSYGVHEFEISDIDHIDVDNKKVYTEKLGVIGCDKIVLCPSYSELCTQRSWNPILLEAYPEIVNQNQFFSDLNYLIKVANSRLVSMKHTVAKENSLKEAQHRIQLESKRIKDEENSEETDSNASLPTPEDVTEDIQSNVVEKLESNKDELPHIVCYIPQTKSKASLMRYMNESATRFKGVVLAAMFHSITTLDLSGNVLESSEFHAVSEVIEASLTLTSVDLSRCGIEAAWASDGFNRIVSGSAPLQTLALNENPIGVVTGSKHSITTLLLRDIKLSDTFPVELSKNLVVLDVSNNRLGDIFGSELLSALLTLETLREVDISGNRLVLEISNLAYSFITLLFKVESFNSSNNPLSDAVAKSFSTYLSSDDQLVCNTKSLNLSSCDLSSNAIQFLLDMLLLYSDKVTSLIDVNLNVNFSLKAPAVLRLAVFLQNNKTVKSLQVNIDSEKISENIPLIVRSLMKNRVLENLVMDKSNVVLSDFKKFLMKGEEIKQESLCDPLRTPFEFIIQLLSKYKKIKWTILTHSPSLLDIEQLDDNTETRVSVVKVKSVPIISRGSVIVGEHEYACDGVVIFPQKTYFKPGTTITFNNEVYDGNSSDISSSCQQNLLIGDAVVRDVFFGGPASCESDGLSILPLSPSSLSHTLFQSVLIAYGILHPSAQVSHTSPVIISLFQKLTKGVPPTTDSVLSLLNSTVRDKQEYLIKSRVPQIVEELLSGCGGQLKIKTAILNQLEKM